MAGKQRAFVVVSRSWVNTDGISEIVNNGRKSQADGDAHMVIAPLHDVSDHRGLWLEKITTDKLRRDGATISLTFMIPWSFVLGLGLLDETDAAASIGFKGTGSTSVFQGQ